MRSHLQRGCSLAGPEQWLSGCSFPREGSRAFLMRGHMLPFSALDPERPERAVSDAPCAGSRAAADAGREEVVFVGMLVTSNRAVGEWGTVFGDAVVATAILDRLLHHSHVVTIRGDSYRLHEKRRSGLLKAPALAEGAAASARARLVQVRAQGPPTRAAPPDSWRSLRRRRVPPMHYLDKPPRHQGCGSKSLNRRSSSQ